MVSSTAIIVIIVIIVIVLILLGVGIWFATRSPPAPPRAPLLTTQATVPQPTATTQPIITQPTSNTGSTSLTTPNGQIQTSIATGPPGIDEGSNRAQVPQNNQLRYGDIVEIFNTNYNSSLKPCHGNNSPFAGGCGVEVAVGLPNEQLTDNDKWVVEGGSIGTEVRYGDIIRLRTNSTLDNEQNLYLSPCGTVTSPTCQNQIDVTLRTNASFTEGSLLRSWIVHGGANGSIVNYNNILQLGPASSTYSSRRLSVCVANTACVFNAVIQAPGSPADNWNFKRTNMNNTNTNNTSNTSNSTSNTTVRRPSRPGTASI